jgi:hypothetical protein
MLLRSKKAMPAIVRCATSTEVGGTRRIAGIRFTLVSVWCLANSPVLGIGQQTAPVPVKVYRYAGHLVEKYDSDGDGRLQPEEWRKMDGNPAAADRDGDGLIAVEELARYIADYGAVRRIRLMPSAAEAAERSPSLLSDGLAAGRSGQTVARSPDGSGNDPAETSAIDASGLPSQRRFAVNPSRLPPGLPAWFLRLDSDGDGQLTQSEFAPTGSPAALQEFDTYDHNGDGIVTAKEAAAGPRLPLGTGQDETRSPASKPNS